MEAWNVAQLSYCWKIGMENRQLPTPNTSRVVLLRNPQSVANYVTCWMIIQRLAERFFWTGCSCHKKLLSFKSIPWNTQHFDYIIFWVGAEIWDFSVRGAYDLSDHKAMVGLGEASNNHSSTILWRTLWKARVPNKIKVFHGILFSLSC